MEILIQENTEAAYRDAAHLTGQSTVAMESVVPDTKDDIGRILSVRPALFLKSRELNGRSVTVRAQASVGIIYLNAAENAVEAFPAGQDFSISFDLPPEAEEDALTQVTLGICGVQTRVLNSRKLSIELETVCELFACARQSYAASQCLPEDCPVTIHVLEEETRAELLAGIYEKAVTFSEQFEISEAEDTPAEIVWLEPNMHFEDRQIIGSRLLLKGEVALTLDYLPEGRAVPKRKTLRLPFSQLIDLENESAQQAAARLTWTHCSHELVSSVEGRKLLNVDLRGLLSVRTTRETTVHSIADAYCNSMPCSCRWEPDTLPPLAETKTIRLTGEDSVELPEDYREMLISYQTPGNCSAAQGTALVEMLCADSENRLLVIRRIVALSAAEETDALAAASCRITEFSAFREGDQLILRLAAEAEGTHTESRPLKRLRSLALDESRAYDRSASPALTAVWAETETVWELAKLYRSTPEAIEALNEDLTKNPVFIPDMP